jgi:hypothetical protein
VDLKLGSKKKRENLCDLTDKLVANLLQKTNPSELSNNSLLLLADAISRCSVFQVELGRFSKARYYSEQSFRLFQKLIERQPYVSRHTSYQLVMWIKICIYPELADVQQCLDWARIHGYYKLQARSLGFLILIRCAPNLHIGSSAAPKVPIPQLTQTVPLLLSLCDQLEEVLQFHEGSVADSQNDIDDQFNRLVINSIRSWIKWDLNSAVRTIVDCFHYAPKITNKNQDYVVFELATFVSVQLVGLSIYHPNLFDDYIKSQISFSQLQNCANILMHYSSTFTWPWGKFVYDFNSTILSHFLDTQKDSKFTLYNN